MAEDSMGLQENDSGGGYNYPPEYESPKIKEKRPYGLKYAKAMYAMSTRVGARFLYEDSEYNALIEVAQGRQSVDNIRKLFGYYANPDEGDDDGSSNLAYIDIQVLNLAPKYINRAVAKMQRFTYDLEVNAVDIVSVEEKKDYAAGIQAFYRLKKWVTDMGLDPKELFPDLDVDALPKYPDEMLYDISVNPKIKKEISAEIAIKLLHYVNKFQQVMREVDWDMVVLGKGHIHCFNDENGVPRVERINPKYVIGSYVDNESFHGQENAGFFDFITVNQLRKEMLADGYSESDIAAIAQRYGSANAIYSTTTAITNWDRFDGLDYIPVLRFYFKSEDNRTFVRMPNKYGSMMNLEKSFDYAPDDSIKHLFESGERKVVTNTYTSIYGGTWILDSDVVFGYGRKKYPRLNLVNATLPIVSFAPNMKEGRVVSLLAQMIEPLYMINVSWNKIKEIIAKGWMGVREIDFTQLEAVSMGKGGQVWTPRDVYKHLLRTNTLIKRSSINKHDQNRSGSGVDVNASGLTLADNFTTFNSAVSILEQMTSSPIASSIAVPDRLSATAAKQSAVTSDVDMEYLFNAHENIYYQGSHMLLLLLQESKKDKKKIAGFIPAMGKVNSGYYEVGEELAYCEYGLMMGRQPTDEEWLNFYGWLENAFTTDKISVSDFAFLMEVDNLKQARQMMAIRERQYKREKAQEAQANNKMAMEANAQASEVKYQGEIAKEKEKGEILKQLEVLKGKIEENLLIKEKQLDAQIAASTNMSKEKMKAQEGVDRMLQQALKNLVEKEKVEKRADKSPED